jgi:hypothetical protein
VKFRASQKPSRAELRFYRLVAQFEQTLHFVIPNRRPLPVRNLLLAGRSREADSSRDKTALGMTNFSSCTTIVYRLGFSLLPLSGTVLGPLASVLDTIVTSVTVDRARVL